MNLEFTIICLLVFAVIMLTVALIILKSDLKETESSIRWHLEQIQELRRDLTSIESRTALYIQEKDGGGYGTSGRPTMAGYTLNDNYLGMDSVMKLLLQKLGFSIQRTMVSEEFYLLDEKAGGSCEKVS